MDTITICDLAVLCHIGVPEEERAKPQRLLITLELARDVKTAANSDDLTGTIDYGAVSRRILEFVKGRSWKLIETLASDIAAAVLKEFLPASVTVEIKKFIIPEARFVSVRITRP